MLETEFDNAAALSLYESLGFIREKRLYRFYMNGKDAFRLILALPPSPSRFLGSDSDSPPSSLSEEGVPIMSLDARKSRLIDIYNTRVIPDFIAGYDDSDSEDEVSMR